MLITGNRDSKKIIVILLLICLIFSNCFALLSPLSFAETNELGKQNTTQFIENINYDVNFVKNDEILGYEYESTVDEKELAIHIAVEVKQEGYLKDGKVLIESENGLSFNIQENNVVNGNVVNLSNVSEGQKIDLVLPITYKEREDIENLNKKINCQLFGTYVNNLGEEKEIYENVVLRLIWKINTEYDITSNIEKYIPYNNENGKGIIVQTSLNTLIPNYNSYVEREKINIDAVQLEGYKIENLSISEKNGDELLSDKWSYDEENNRISIRLENNSETIKSQEYIVTYNFSGEDEIELPLKINSNVSGSIFMFRNNESKDIEKEIEYNVTKKVGEIITFDAVSDAEMKIGKLIANKISKQNQYSLNYNVQLTSNISSTDLVEGILIKDNGEEFINKKETLTNSDSFYKSVKISKENFETILGTDGSIKIQNEDGEILKEINKDTQLDEQNNYKIDLEENINQIYIKTSKPMSIGNLIINIQKEINNSDYSAEQLKKFEELKIKYTTGILFLNNIENKTDDIETKIKLIKPTTKADLSISNNTLSTIAENNYVELAIKLNNTNEDIDLYENPNFTVVFPSYIEDIEISNIAIANNEDTFKIADAKIDRDKDGKVVLDIKLEGRQEVYNSNYLTNGTNIIINANIKLNIYTPIKEDKITMSYTNKNVTSYDNNNPYSEVTISYKAPIGMVSVNEISNYDNNGSSIVSVAQGKVTDKIEIFDSAKKAKMNILVMNNNQNNCNDIKILGRVPFKGNKDVRTNEDLGTTIDTKLISKIVENDENLAEATIYYSSNGEATLDLENQENGWTLKPEDLSEIKSYLIIPKNYEMKPGEILRYSYTFEIPANLEHNAYIYGSFATIYTNLKEVAVINEISSPDLVGLTTGVGTQIKAQITTNVKGNVKEYEKIKYTTEIENTGTDTAEDVKITVPIPKEATLAVNSTINTVDMAKGWSLKSNREFTKTIKEIKPGEKKTVNFYVQINKLPSIEEYYANQKGFSKNSDGTYSIIETYKDENGETKTNIIDVSNIPEVTIKTEAVITAKELAKELVAESNELHVEKAEIVSEETISTQEDIARVGETIEAKIEVKNNTDKTMENILITKVLPEGLNFSESYIREYQNDGVTLKKTFANNYNPETKTITWKLDKLEPEKTSIVICKLVVANMKDNVYKQTISTYSTIEANGQNYQAGQVDITVGRPNLVVKQLTNTKNEFVKVGDELQYVFNVENKGSVIANDVVVKDLLPDDVEIKKLVYTIDGKEISKVVAQNEDAVVYGNLEPDNKMDINITVKVKDINSKEKEIKNVAQITAKNDSNIKSNMLINTIERTENNVKLANSKNSVEDIEKLNINSENEEIKTRYEIKGTAWLDVNGNGIKEKSEERFSGLKVKLINTANNQIIAQEITDENGIYEFKNLENGKYIAVFYYDASRYGLTDYRKNNVDTDENSDVISAMADNVNIATTDIINVKDGSQSNIDIGLIEAKTFDLSIEKSISKVTVQTRDNTKAYDFNNEKLAKVDINGKYLRDAIVFVEYTFEIANKGEVDGYAKNIIDYLPVGLDFSTELNKNWYKGTDGNLYTTELENEIIPKGENKTVKLVLTKKMTEENTGIVNNQAEIYQTYNKFGIADKDIKSDNKENNNKSSADLIIGVQTGNALINISIVIITLIATLVILFIVNKTKIITKVQMRIEKGV